MSARLTGIVATLWFFFAVASLFIALALSPLGIRLLLPGLHPTSWIYPALLLFPPLLLIGQRVMGERAARSLGWILAISMTAAGLLLFAFLAATFLGPLA